MQTRYALERASQIGILRVLIKHIRASLNFCSAAFFISLSPLLSFAEGLGSLEKTSYRIEERTKLILDGSAEASEIERSSETVNRLTYVDSENFRAKRELPFKKASREILKEAGTFFTMSATNKKSPTQILPGPGFWEEIALSPLQMAKSWSLADGGESLDDFLDRMRKVKEPLKNIEGDRIEVTVLENGGLRLTFIGKLLHEKTKVKIESQWELKDLGKVNLESLSTSLMKAS